MNLLTELASRSPVGARWLLFNLSLAGGKMLDDSQYIRGTLIGLDLSHVLDDVVRAVLEGISMGLARSLRALQKLVNCENEMILVGSGSFSSFGARYLPTCMV
jgi:xylulokinase